MSLEKFRSRIEGNGMKRLAFCLLFIVVIAAGCTTARAPRYYFLTAAPVSPQANVSQFPVTILVGRLSAPRILRDDRVVYGMTDVEMGVDEYHRWTEPPTEMIEQLLVEHLRRSGQYKSVQRISSTARGDYLLRGHLTSLNERDDPVEKKSVSAVVESLQKNVNTGIAQLTGSLAQYFASRPAK